MTIWGRAVATIGVVFLVAACGDSSEPPASEPAAFSIPDLAAVAAEGGRVALGRGDVAPRFSGEVLNGSRIDLAALRGRPVVLNFWLTTCEPCIREMPALAAVMGDHQAENLIVVGVNFGESPEVINAFIDGFDVELGFPILLDRDGEVVRTYEVAALPTTYFIDREGMIRYRRVGELAEEHIAVGVARITR